jgi:hypothetical protein
LLVVPDSLRLARRRAGLCQLEAERLAIADAAWFATFIKALPPFDIAPPPPPYRQRNSPGFELGKIVFRCHVLSLEGVWLELKVHRRRQSEGESGTLRLRPGRGSSVTACRVRSW